MTPAQLEQRLDLAITAGREAAAITLQYYRQDNLQIETKADRSPVTVADRAAEQHLRNRIAAAFPQDGILGEEYGEVVGTSGFRWILDPIDGTKSFIHGVPLYGTLVGVEFEEHGVIGVNLLPALDEYLYGAIGLGAWHVRGNTAPKPARVSKTQKLSEAMFCTTSVTTYEQSGRREVYEELRKAAGLARGWGDCYGYALVATGQADVMVDPKMNVWDCCALEPILREAGGTFTDWNGNPTIHAGEGIATNGILLPEVLAVVRAGLQLV